MNLDEREQPCRESWENEYDYLQKDRFAKIGKGRYNIRNFNEYTYGGATPVSKPE